MPMLDDRNTTVDPQIGSAAVGREVAVAAGK
jgi:hypothetical protein